MPGGGQPGNKNAEKWTEEKALKLGNELIEWLTEEDNVFFKYFLLVHKKLDDSLINYLGKKFKSFSEIIKKARKIQEVKLMMLSFNDKNKSSTMGIWTLKVHYGQKEGSRDSYDFEKEEKIARMPVTKAFEATRIYKLNYYTGNNKIIINRGGTRSSKTYTLCQIMNDWLMTGIWGNITDAKKVDFIRKTLPDLKNSILRDVREIRDKREMAEEISEKKVDKVFKYLDRELNYFSVQDEGKIRSAKRDILVIEEADQLTWDEFRQLLLRTKYTVYLLFNPSDEVIWINQELELKRLPDKRDVKVIQSSYMDNDFLTPEQIDEIEYLKETDDEYWQIFGLGNYGTISGLVYKEPFINYIELPKANLFRIFGLDFGFVSSQNALLELNINKDKREVYLKEHFYSTGMGTNEIIDEVKQSNPENDLVICDNAEPRLIRELQVAGINAAKCDKKYGIVGGIRTTKKYKIFVHEDSINVKKERSLYKRPKNKDTGKYIEKPIDMFNHLLKAFVYALTYYELVYGHRYKSK